MPMGNGGADFAPKIKTKEKDNGIEWKESDPSAISDAEEAVINMFAEWYNPGAPSGGGGGWYKDQKARQKVKKKFEASLQGLTSWLGDIAQHTTWIHPHLEIRPYLGTRDAFFVIGPLKKEEKILVFWSYDQQKVEELLLETDKPTTYYVENTVHACEDIGVWAWISVAYKEKMERENNNDTL